VCTQQISVGIYGGYQDPTRGCLVPDPNVVLCPAQIFNVTPPTTGTFIVGFPIAPGCCISQPAFLKIEFVNLAAGCNTSATVPRLVTTAVCNGCESWNIYPGGGPDD